MKRLMILAGLALLVGCKEDVASLPAPVEITAEAAGYYCQMALLEHVGPKGQIHLDGMPAPIFFSQVRDAIAYLHMPEQSHAVTVTYVQDMAGATWDRPGPWIPADAAIYVLGSDIRGGMDAPEFVPFGDENAARAFAALHGGDLRTFDDITAQDALSDEHAAEAAAPNSDMADRLRALAQNGD